MIAIIAAMQPEIKLIHDSVVDPKSEHWNDWEFISGKLAGRDIVAVRTGVGKVLAAAVTQRLIDRYEPEAVIMVGVAGSINPALRKGDIVIGTECIQHDFDSTPFGFRRGEIPYTNYSIVSSDERLVGIALKSKLPVKTGRVLTGDQFITGADTPEFEYLRTEMKGDLVEMEGAAAGLTAMLNKIPFLLIRTVSDNADGESKGSYRRFLKTSSQRSFELIHCILENY